MRTMKCAVVLALCALQVSCQVILTRNFDPQDCIIEGTVVTLTCIVEDRNDGFGATIINGSQAIFDCPSVIRIVSDSLYLRHSQKQSARASCGELVSGRLMEVELNGTTSVYTAQISITTTIAMNGGYVECSEQGKNDGRRIILANIIAFPTIYVEFPSDASFLIHWNQFNEGPQISHYSTNVTGEDCGNCTNFDRIVNNVTNQLSCTGWEPTGQVCNVTVTAVGFACDLRQLSSSLLVYLRVPEAPLLENIMPAYSYDLEELQSIEILLAVESTVDPNGLPITFQVNVDRSSQTDYEISKCSLNISPGNKCLSKYSKFHCEIAFTVTSCSQILSQPEQEADYQIVVFSQSSIGRSSLNAISNVTVPSYAHLMVQLLFEPQQDQEEHHLIFINFRKVYEKVTFMIEYGPNCQTLDNQTTIFRFNVTTLTFYVPSILDDQICFIVTINNTFQSLAIQGNFSFNTQSSRPPEANQELNYDFIIGAAIGSALFIMVIIIISTLICYIQRRRHQQTNNFSSFRILQSKLLSSEVHH